ncbi:uncharacterized protein LOC112340558 isoform X2 [Selaginella moellendorffii]|uniref:uncharacterized protein LOC112340558 isoform X2 n=1 Tax=Selaginella moellendorffii TaxID=88036 RepID=UPI000D1C3C90|nr:uncharacterized protein LOC112340558 isoform X2 [Selaginella moellendorffii]|eukprot:XP_024514972.1 uncharacterized protein LOC112340558 isoform X2 [Selaginella moellendorffii]
MDARFAKVSFGLSDLFLTISFESQLPRFVTVAIEVPRGSFVKRRVDGSVDFIAPLPCPFNYGSVSSIPAPDGDPLDALVLGEILPYNAATTHRVVGVVRFTDAGFTDNKLVCVQADRNLKRRKEELLSISMRRRKNFSAAAKAMIRESIDDDHLRLLDYCSLTAFFGIYAIFKRGLNAARGRGGETVFHGVEIFPPSP